jgi:hypothetical protein
LGFRVERTYNSDIENMTGLAPGKCEYTEAETALALGITIEELRALVRTHVTANEEDLNNVAVMSFRPSDILMLRLLSGRGLIPTLPD